MIGFFKRLAVFGGKAPPPPLLCATVGEALG